jgi:hypothetical protein
MKAKSGLTWSVGWDPARAGWLSADLLMRMLTATSVEPTQYVLEPRIFSADNIAELDISQAGWNSSNWFGGPGYQDDLKALWK